MYDQTSLDRDLRRVADELTIPDPALAAKRQRGLRFILQAQDGQTLDEVRAVFTAMHPGFEVEALFPAGDFEPVAEGEAPPFPLYLSGYVATLLGLSVEDVEQDALGIAEEAKLRGGFVDIGVDVAVENPFPGTVQEIDADQLDASTSAWALEAMRVPQAWAAAGGNRGRGVSIGHPDTGWSPHAEWEHGGLDLSRQRNFISGEPQGDARDRFNGGGTLQPGHGTHTAGVMVCRGGIEGGRFTPPGRLTGVAPDALNVPLRAVTSVILFPGQLEVARAIVYGVQVGCRVISLSLGGVGLLGVLSQAIVYAIGKQCVVVAASGNYPDWVAPGLRFAVEPAIWPNVAGVAGSTRGDKPWESSGRVPYGSVAIAAPGHQVPMTVAVRPGQDPHRYGLGSGTSYATALVAGVAALWLAHHFGGRYTGPGTAQAAFMAQLRRTARRPSGWNTWFGPGIVDAHRMIAERPGVVEIDGANGDPQRAAS